MTQNNPPAFPSAARDGNWQPHCDGMTLRDYFAAAALSGSGVVTSNCAGNLAHYAYLIADAMLAEREKTNG